MVSCAVAQARISQSSTGGSTMCREEKNLFLWILGGDVVMMGEEH